MCKKHADQKWRDDPLCCKEGLWQWKIACVIHFTVDFSPPPTGNLVSECSAVTNREKSLYRKTRWRTLTETEEMASDLTLRCKGLKEQKGMDENFESEKAKVLFFWFIYKTCYLVPHLDLSLVSFPLYIIRWRRGCVSWLPVAGALGQTELSLELTGHPWVWTPETAQTEKHIHIVFLDLSWTKY